MRALFVGGPWNGQVREITERPGDVIVAPEISKISDYLHDALNGATYLSRLCRYTPMRVGFFGSLLNLYVSEDMHFNPHLDAVLVTMLLRDEFRGALS